MSRLRLAIVSLVLAGCGERAALVDFAVEVPGDALCVWAWGDGERVFAERYDASDEQDRPASGSLTFVAGSRVSDGVRIGARVVRGGAIAGEARAHVPLTDGFAETTLRVRRCAPFDGPPVALEPAGMLPGGPVVAADLDGDGADELASVDRGALQVLRAGELSSVSLAADAIVAGVADTDEDCALELALASDDDVRLATDASIGEPVIGGARALAFGRFTSSGAQIARATPTGLSVGILGGAGATFDGAFGDLDAGDLDGDGFDDLVASGPGGTRYFLGGAGGVREVPGGLPPRVASALGPLVLADLDGDGRLDLAVADGTALRFAIDRGDGLLEERGGATPIASSAPIVALRAGDVDGDCLEEVIAIATDGSALVARLTAGRPELVDGEWPAAADAAVADLDGDGARELAWITTEGEVLAWRP